MPRHLAWEKADTGQLREYRATLQRRLEELEDPQSLACEDVRCKQHNHSKERDRHVLEVMTAWTEASYSSVPVVPPARPAVPGKERTSGALPGSPEPCEPLRHDTKLWCGCLLAGLQLESCIASRSPRQSGQGRGKVCKSTQPLVSGGKWRPCSAAGNAQGTAQ